MYNIFIICFHELLVFSVCESLSLNKTIVVGKVVLCFTTMGRQAITNASAVVKEAGGVGIIIAKNPRDALYPCNEDFPCIEVDYEIGTRILFYIRSTRYLTLNFIVKCVISTSRFACNPPKFVWSAQISSCKAEPS